MPTGYACFVPIESLNDLSIKSCRAPPIVVGRQQSLSAGDNRDGRFGGVDIRCQRRVHRGCLGKARTMVGTRRLRFALAPRQLVLMGSLLALGTMSGCVELSDGTGVTDGLGGDRGTGGSAGIGSDGGMGGSAGTGGGAGGSAGIDGGVIEASALDPEPNESEVSVVCGTNLEPELWSRLPWELTVDPAPIESGAGFSARFSGVALFTESLLDIAQEVIAGGVKEINLLELQATVLAYSGASGPPVVLTTESVPYQCTFEDPPGTRPTCDPAHDVPDGGPGQVGNTDCQPQGAFNPCGRFYPLPTSDDCTVGGTCWNLDREEAGPTCNDDAFCKAAADSQCANNGFCITGPLRLPLTSPAQDYVADPSGEVRFGWHESDRGGEWRLPGAVFQEPVGPTGLRFYIGNLQVAFECVLGGQDGGLFGRVPDNELTSFPILDRVCSDATNVCPEAFVSAEDGQCRFSTQSALITMEDPRGSPSVCPGLPSVSRVESALPVAEASILRSPSLAVRGTIEAKNVEDEACLASSEIIADLNFLDETKTGLANSVLIFNRPTEVGVSLVDPSLRSTTIIPGDVLWSSSSDACCQRTFQTIWQVSVGQCEGW
jgi:hypothetical protein